MIPSQRELWDRKHSEGEHAEYRGEPLPFTKEVERLFPRNSYVLDLGCGVGGSDFYFADLGHTVLATDFSEQVIAQNRHYPASDNLTFEVVDMSEPLQYSDEQFDVVFAHLSLHYFDDATTRKIMSEVTRVLKPEGLFCFACKTPNDADYGNGQEIETDFYVSSKGHARHFFSEQYARVLLANKFIVESMKEVTESYGSKESAFLQCVARKQ